MQLAAELGNGGGAGARDLGELEVAPVEPLVQSQFMEGGRGQNVETDQAQRLYEQSTAADLVSLLGRGLPGLTPDVQSVGDEVPGVAGEPSEVQTRATPYGTTGAGRLHERGSDATGQTIGDTRKEVEEAVVVRGFGDGFADLTRVDEFLCGEQLTVLDQGTDTSLFHAGVHRGITQCVESLDESGRRFLPVLGQAPLHCVDPRPGLRQVGVLR